MGQTPQELLKYRWLEKSDVVRRITHRGMLDFLVYYTASWKRPKRVYNAHWILNTCVNTIKYGDDGIIGFNRWGISNVLDGIVCLR